MEPLVSIILTLYNGERFVRQAIQSVQAQTWKNWEMIVVDDASSDGSAEAVEAIDDPRISLIRLEKNGQVCNAHRVGDRAAKGEFIAVLDKDDAWEPAKLEKQMAYMAAHPEAGACFTRVSFMDEEGRAVSHPFMEQIFTAPNRDREAWVHDLMTKGNCLCHSSALIRKDVLEEIGGYNYLFLQLQDYDLWLRIALLRDLYVIQEPLVRYRRFEDSGSLSQNDADRDRRTFFEYARIVGTTVREMDADLFRRAFAGEMRFRNAASPEEILCEKAILLASDHLVTNCKGEAFALFAELFRSEKGIAVLRDQYGLTQHDVYRMTGKPIQYDRTTEQVITRLSGDLEAGAQREKELNTRLQDAGETIRLNGEALRAQAEAMREQEVSLREANLTVQSQREEIRAMDETIREKDDAIRGKDEAIRQKDEAIRSAGETIRVLGDRAHRAESDFAEIQGSFFWRLTGPARKTGIWVKKAISKNEKLYLAARIGKVALRNGPKEAGRRYRDYKKYQARAAQYGAESGGAAEQDSASVLKTATGWTSRVERQLAPCTGDILFSVLVPLYNTPDVFLREMIESVQNQTYDNWQLCLADASDAQHPGVEKICRAYAEKDPRIVYRKLEKNLMISGNTNAALSMADGDYIALLDHDDLIAPFALEDNERAIREKGWDVLYSDEDHLLMDGTHGNPLYKPDYSPDLLHMQMYICHFLVVRRELMEAVGGFRTDYDGSQDYDLMLRLSEKTGKVGHIPELLYTWRESPSSTAANADSKPYAQTAGQKALNDHLKRVYGDEARADEYEWLFVYDARYPLPKDTKVSIIIPMKDKWELTDACIRSIEEKSTWRNFEILVLDNRSAEKATFDWFEKIAKEFPEVRVMKADMEFNWSKINNFGYRHADGDVIIFLNNDTLVITPDWMERLSEKALRDETGCVGPLLLYEDGTIQHAGVVVGMGGWADHLFKGMQPVHYGAPFISPMVTRNVTAVTGACTAVSRKTLEKIGLYDESFIICGSDVELGIRASQAGLYNVYDATVKLYHLESKSRDSYIPEEDFKRSWEVYTPYREGRDPFFNENLDRDSAAPKERPRFPVYAVKTEEKAARPAREKAPRARKTVPVSSLAIAEVRPMYPRVDKTEGRRLNLIIPSVDVKHVFGGIATALNFFEDLVQTSGWDARIITVDAEYNAASSVRLPGYEEVRADRDSSLRRQIVSMVQRDRATLAVRGDDVFVVTGWWTAYMFRSVYHWQRRNWPDRKAWPMIYLIQDSEPGFYPWSSRYLMAESTYRMDLPVYAVFNSGLLKDYFDAKQYTFEASWSFEPMLNRSLKSFLPENRRATKKKQILVYGRPGTPRNAFELLCMALSEFAALRPENREWTFLSAGEEHDNVDLGHGAVLRSLGKLSLEEYARIMLETYAGVSLMVSPHPSYPPLEMATFGIQTVVNRFGAKDLSRFSPCMVNVESCSAEEIARKLDEVCAGYHSEVSWQVNESYLAEGHAFGTAVAEIAEALNKA